MNKVFTAGYSGHSPMDLLTVATELVATVIDTRLRPLSPKPGWSDHELISLLGDRYVHCRDLGNVNYKKGAGDPHLFNPFAGLETVREHLVHSNVILLCACPDEATCHRSIISRLLRERYGIETTPVVWPSGKIEWVQCLSLWQPWASLIAIGAKTIESRGWFTSYRGPLAIHAGKSLAGINECKMMPDAELHFFLRALNLKSVEEMETLPRGAVLTTVNLVDCKPAEEFRDSISLAEQMFGFYYGESRFGWFLQDNQPLPQPVPLGGRQGLFKFDRALLLPR